MIAHPIAFALLTIVFFAALMYTGRQIARGKK